MVHWVELCGLAAPEDVISRRYGIRIVEGEGADVERFGLVFDCNDEWRPALRAEGSLPEAARADAPDRICAGSCDPVAALDAGKRLRRCSAAELAGAAMAPAAVERLTLELKAYRPAHASAGHSHPSPLN